MATDFVALASKVSNNKPGADETAQMQWLGC